MKVLVIGSGGREHALVWKLAQSEHVTALWCAPGNAGTAEERLSENGIPVQNAAIQAEDLPRLLSFAQESGIDLVVVGPDNPLAMGIVDLFESHGIGIWGPNQKAARFESSKAFAQSFMERYRIPTARSATFQEAGPAKRFAAALEGRCAVKADGLALGKGVLICTGLPEAERAIDRILTHREFGDAGEQVVIQELLEGVEVSVHALCDGESARLFPTSQDHKRAFDGDAGPNTGGMGSYSPAPFLSEAQVEWVEKRILEPWLQGCAAEGIRFRGILYPGLILTADGLKVLEFNARFGDPETQVYLMRMQNDLLELIEASRRGRLGEVDLRWDPRSAVCVVMASGGYPGAYEKGKVISGLTEVSQFPNTKVFHAGTSRSGEQIVSHGGRVLGVTALAEDLLAARHSAYSGVEQIRFDGAYYRRDIAARGLLAEPRDR